MKDPEQGFKVKIAGSGQVVDVPAGSTILDALLDAGVYVSCSCREGICGACEVAVVSGTPDHRDFVLSDEERASNNKMMICVSRSLSDELVIDII